MRVVTSASFSSSPFKCIYGLLVVAFFGLCFAETKKTKSTIDGHLSLNGKNHYVVGDKVVVVAKLSNAIRVDVPVYLRCDGPKCDAVFECTNCSKAIIKANSTVPIKFELPSKAIGITTLIAKSSKNVETSTAFVDVSVGHSYRIVILSNIVGWIYFLAWSISFYPQLWTNYRRKSVVGLNFDFLSLNLSGFVFYSLFNICLYFLPSYQSEYRIFKPYTNIPVELNDVVFSVHAVLLTSITILQCFCYDRGGQRVSYVAIMILIALWLTAGVMLILVLLKVMNKLYYAYYFSYAKLGITVFKYTPQAFQNYRRKSTEGWSIGNVLLDFVGGSFSIFQMFLTAYNFDDWSNIFGNFSKFGLGMVSIIFDVVFMLQHYVFFRNKEETALLSTSVDKGIDNDAVIQPIDE